MNEKRDRKILTPQILAHSTNTMTASKHVCLPCVNKDPVPSKYYGSDCGFAITSGNRLKEFVSVAIEEAKRSPMTQKHGCVVIFRNKIVAVGHNKPVEPFPLTSIHAEVNALMKAKKLLKKSELKQSKLLVVRIGTDSMDNPLKYSKPCKVCESFIDKLGIQMVYYSTSGV